MAGAKPTMILKSRTELSDEEIEALSDSEAWGIIYSLKSRGSSKTKKKVVDTRQYVCFTGFPTERKQELTDIAYDNRLQVVQSVTQKLNYLVCGINAGPKKMEKARSQGVSVMTEFSFLNMLDTGEVSC